MDEIIGRELLRNLLLAMTAVMAISLVVLTNVQIWLLLFGTMIVTLVNMIGFAKYWAMDIDVTTCVFFVLAIGVGIDYASHVALAFVTAKGTEWVGIKRKVGKELNWN